jgi:predicted DNA-binding transcriptional regulator AlpA
LKIPNDASILAVEIESTIMIENVTLETLPKAFMQLYMEVIEMKKMMQDQRQSKQEQTDKIMNLEATAKFLQRSPNTIYGLVSKGSIPYMKRGKCLYFSVEELTAWLKAGRKDKQQMEIPTIQTIKRKAA